MDNQNQSNMNGNNVTAFTHKAAIKEEAGNWLVRMDNGELSTEEAAELRAWVKRSEFHLDYLTKLAHNWDAMSVLEDLAELFPLPSSDQEKHLKKHFENVGNKSRQSSASTRIAAWVGKFRLPIFATSMVAASLVVVIFFSVNGPASQSFSTALGEQRVERLQDGTVLTLNTNSLVDVNYSRQHRVVTLQRGEVNFDVEKHTERPFVVYAGDGLVWAVGTAFNIRLNSRSVDVTVTEGRVKVFTDIRASEPLPSLTVDLRVVNDQTVPNEALLDAGESLQYSQIIEVAEPVMEKQLEQKLAWQQGALIFKGETFEQALTEIARYTDKELVIIDPTIRDARVGGHYKTNDIDNLLGTLSRSLNIKLTQINEHLVQFSAR